MHRGAANAPALADTLVSSLHTGVTLRADAISSAAASHPRGFWLQQVFLHLGPTIELQGCLSARLRSLLEGTRMRLSVKRVGGAVILLAVACTGGPRIASPTVASGTPATADSSLSDPQAPLLVGTLECPDPMAVLRAFYDANNADRPDVSLALLTSEAVVATWAEGVNGRHWQERHLIGRDEIRPILSTLGFRTTSGAAGAPIFRETEVRGTADHVSFMLRPDRLAPDGRQHNPYKVDVTFDGCSISSLTVVEIISWE